MPLPPIQIQLTKFENIEILRQEIELREEELKQTEKYIRGILWEVERQKYLQTVHPLFQQLQTPAEAANLPQFHSNREALAAAVETMQAELKRLEAETKGQTAPSGWKANMPARAGQPAAPGLQAKKAKFDSFDDFRTQRPGGPGRT